MIWSAARSDAQGGNGTAASCRRSQGGSIRSHSSREGRRRGARQRVRGCGSCLARAPPHPAGVRTAGPRRQDGHKLIKGNSAHNLTCQLSNMGNLDLHLHGFSRVLQVNKKGVWLRCHERSVALAAHAVRKQQHDVRRTEYCAVLYHNPSFFFSSQLLNSDVMS